MRKITFFKTMLVAIALIAANFNAWGQIAAWDFTGASSPATLASTTFNANLVSASGANNVTRGTGAATSSASNSLRTTGFGNNGIATTNADYFQVTLNAATGYQLSLSTIDAKFAGTSSFCASPGVSNQFAYSLNGTAFTLIGSAQALIGSPATLTQIDLSGITALQNVAAGTTITLRYYASGQTTTGGWGFNSPTSGQNGLAIGGTVTAASSSATATPTFNVNGGTFTSSQSITMSSTTTNAKIYYTLNGDVPTSASNLYSSSNPIVLNTTATTTIKAIAYDASNANPSSVESQTYIINVDPVISTDKTTIPSMYSQVGSNNTQTFNVSGTNLTGDITATLSGTNSDQFLVSPISVAQTGGNVATTLITITYTPTAAGNHSATLTLKSAGATDKMLSLTATGVWPPVSVVVATDATGVNSSGFTANWNTATGATSYDLNVYVKSGTKTTEGFNGGTTAPTNWTFTSIGATYTSAGYYGAASPSVKLDATNDAVITPLFDNAATGISFWIVGASTDATSALLVEGSSNGSSWTAIENINPLPTTGTIKVYNQSSTPALAAGYKTFKFTYTKSVGNLGLDDFTYMYNYVETPIISSPFTITELTKSVSGLTSETNYFYTVVAKSANVTASPSNEISVTTGKTTDLKETIVTNVYALKGNVYISANANQTIEIYNAVGQKLVSKQTVSGLNTIPVTARGIILVKLGEKITKVIL